MLLAIFSGVVPRTTQCGGRSEFRVVDENKEKNTGPAGPHMVLFSSRFRSTSHMGIPPALCDISTEEQLSQFPLVAVPRTTHGGGWLQFSIFSTTEFNKITQTFRSRKKLVELAFSLN
jgi:hypothetical protein